MADEEGTQEGVEDVQPIIPGTTYKTPEDAAKGFAELKALVDKQGNELGLTRKQLAEAQAMPKRVEPEQPKGPDFKTELSKIDKAIEALDVDDPDYTKELAALSKQGRQIESQRVAAEVAESLTSKFEKVLNDRDAKAGEKQWLEQNPDFETPEMQTAIQEKMQGDKTGLMDEFLAYREIQNEQLQRKLQEITTENEDYKTRLNLKRGEDNVGKVYTKGSGMSSDGKPKQKVTGTALDEGMREAFRAAS